MIRQKRLTTTALLLACVVVTSCAGGVDLLDWSTLGGQILTRDGSPVEGVEVAIYFPDSFQDDKYLYEQTDKDGWYSHDRGYLNPNDDTVITPSHSGYLFSPANYVIYENSGDHLDLDFTAIALN